MVKNLGVGQSASFRRLWREIYFLCFLACCISQLLDMALLSIVLAYCLYNPNSAIYFPTFKDCCYLATCDDPHSL